jgi:DNA-binding transcriptional LysR family regulator
METDRLHQLRILSATESLTETASLLGMTPGALSKSMRVLSSQLGFPVYESAGRGLRLSERAKRVAQLSEGILKSLESLRGEGTESAVPAERLRLGSFEVFTGKLARFYFSDFPDSSQLECHELVPGEIEEALLGGEIDVGITYQPIPRSDIAYQKVLTLKMGIFGASKFQGYSLQELPFVTPLAETSAGQTRAKGLDGWDDLKFPRRIVHRVNLLETGIQLASVGQAVIFMPAFLARIFNEGLLASGRLLSLEHRIPPRMGAQDVFLVTRRGEEESLWARRVAKLLRQRCRD